jgi:gamma-glutamyltranspeptidase/glutathione hydrolase
MPVLLGLLALAACGQPETPGVVGSVRGFLGGAVADEPRAALVARDILSAGGTAADAAVALYFALSVTMPASAGLGGGGMCLVYDPKLNRSEALDFVARAPAQGGSGAVPGNPRGMFALHAKYGRLQWQQVLSPAEGLARFGTPVSRALAAELAAAAPAVDDPELKRLISGSDGAPLAEGALLSQRELVAVISTIRQRGVGEFYTGFLARQFIAAARQAGAAFTLDDLRGALPTWRPAITVNDGDLTLSFAPPPAVAGLMEGELWSMLSTRWRRAAAEERPHLFAAASLRAAWDRDRWLTTDLQTSVPPAELVGERRANELMSSYRSDQRTAPTSLSPPPVERPGLPGATTFVVADRNGGAVACAVTLHGYFGTGRLAPGTGIVIAAVPDGAGRGPQWLSPMLAARGRAGQLVFAGAASGGAPGASALIGVALRTLVDGRPLEEAMDAPRLHYAGAPDVALVEAGRESQFATLRARGYTLAPAPAIGRVNAMSCRGGLADEPQTCEFRADRFGFAAIGG